MIGELEKIIDHAQRDSYLFNYPMKFYFTHTDLTTSNILIDENTGQIRAILDWERCAMTFSSNDLDFYSSWFNDQQFKSTVQLGLHLNKQFLSIFNDFFTKHNWPFRHLMSIHSLMDQK